VDLKGAIKGKRLKTWVKRNREREREKEGDREGEMQGRRSHLRSICLCV